MHRNVYCNFSPLTRVPIILSTFRKSQQKQEGLPKRGYEYLKHLLSVVVEHIYDTDPAYLEDLMPWSENLPDICRKDS